VYSYQALGVGEGGGVAVVSVLSPVSFFTQAHPFNNNATTANTLNVLAILIIISSL
jgi:hypothetical protein